MAINNFLFSLPPESWGQGIHDLSNRWTKAMELGGEYIVETSIVLNKLLDKKIRCKILVQEFSINLIK